MKKSIPKQRAKRPKAPKAEVYFSSSPSGIYFDLTTYALTDSHYPVAVLPTRTQQQARQLVRWANLSYAQKVGELAKALATHAYSTRVEDYHGEAKCILNLLGESPDPEN